MNKAIAKIGAMIVLATVILFAVCMLIPFDFGSYFVCMVLPIGYIMMTAGFCSECHEKYKTAANVGMVFAAIYATLIVIVYFAQLTVVRFGTVNEQAMRILDFQKGGLLFNYDLLGYGMMALSTFFVGLTIDGKATTDRWLKRLMMIHGIFFFACLIMPMTGMFRSMDNGSSAIGGVIALECWCVYFIPVSVLSIIHFGKEHR